MIYTIDMLIEKIISGERTYDLERITSAYELAKVAHDQQTRDSGEPYISHPVAVAYILVELGMDTDTICAALLHDVVEDTDMPLKTVQDKFGEDVALLVNGVTKLDLLTSASTIEEYKAENVRKMLLAMSQDIRVIIIKLADRLHNMRTMDAKPEQKRRDKAHETMEVYVPLAHRLGIRAIKEELEDRSFYYLDPVAYAEIERALAIRKDARESFIESIKSKIAERICDIQPPPQIDGRVKSLYGIYKKVYIAGRSFDEIFDIYAVRIIVSTVIECYNVLGIIHDMFRPIPNRFKDYISTPKTNMYQSLHTTVIGREGIPFEVQIRTWDMHYTAEYGIAAHWKYKAGISGKDKLEERLAWLRQMIESQQETDNPEELVHAIKSDLAPEEVFAFTPKGDVISLPAESTIIDFAYAIHTEVGHKMTGAKVDGRIAPLDYQIKTGDIVEILTSKGHTPVRSWLNIAKTNEAKSKIRSWFKRERREENIKEGKEELEREFKRNNISLPADELESFIADIAKRQHCETVDDFYAAVGYGGIILSRIISRIKDDYSKLMAAKRQENEPQLPIITPARSTKDISGIVVEGIDNCLVKFAQCCNPLPGDDVIGFITRGHGVSVHKRDCANVRAGLNNPDSTGRWIRVHWADNVQTHYRCTLDIVARDRTGLLADISMALTSIRVPIHELNARELKNGNANLVITIGIPSVEQLKSIIQKISKVDGVLQVERSGK